MIELYGQYNSHASKANGIVTLKIECDGTDKDRVVNLITENNIIGEDLYIKYTELNINNIIDLGLFKIEKINFNRNFDAVIEFKGVGDYIELDNLNTFMYLETLTKLKFIIEKEKNSELSENNKKQEEWEDDSEEWEEVD